MQHIKLSRDKKQMQVHRRDNGRSTIEGQGVVQVAVFTPISEVFTTIRFE